MIYMVVFDEDKEIQGLWEVPSGEAIIWAMISYELHTCNVYEMGGSMQPLYTTDIVR